MCRWGSETSEVFWICFLSIWHGLLLLKTAISDVFLQIQLGPCIGNFRCLILSLYLSQNIIKSRFSVTSFTFSVIFSYLVFRSHDGNSLWICNCCFSFLKSLFVDLIILTFLSLKDPSIFLVFFFLPSSCGSLFLSFMGFDDMRCNVSGRNRCFRFLGQSSWLWGFIYWCWKVVWFRFLQVGAPPEIASLLDEIRRESDMSKRNASCSTRLGADPELDEFMVSL